MLRVSSGFQTLENNKTTRPAASWFQMFSRVWKPDETLALVFEIVLRFLRLQGIARDWSKHNEHSRNIFSVHGFLRLSVKPLLQF